LILYLFDSSGEIFQPAVQMAKGIVRKSGRIPNECLKNGLLIQGCTTAIGAGRNAGALGWLYGPFKNLHLGPVSGTLAEK
jgi:hypothetical protein